MYSFSAVSKTYDGLSPVLSGLDLEIATGEFVVFVGPSGSGKTTTLKMMNRLIEPSSGEILRAGKPLADYDLTQLRRETGYVLQNIALFPNMSVGDNVRLLPEILHWSPADIDEAAHSLMEQVGLPWQEYANRRPQELSGGQQQRVALVRALISHPPVLLLDEPLSALDPLTRLSLQDLLRQLHEAHGLTSILVTHDMREALALADRIVVFGHGEVIQQGSPGHIQAHPADSLVRQLLATAHC